MTTNVQNRQTIREAYAALLVTALVGSGKPAQRVYEYVPGDFHGRYSIAAIDSSPGIRSKQAQVARVSSGVNMDLHTFVLYADPPTEATNDTTAGSNKVIQMANTSNFEDFEVGDAVVVEDDNHTEIATVTVMATDVSITVDTLAYAYTKPRVYWWHEKLAANRLDLFEKIISDVNLENDTNDIWEQLSLDGKPTRDDVTIGGKGYMHEVFHVNFRLKSD